MTDNSSDNLGVLLAFLCISSTGMGALLVSVYAAFRGRKVLRDRGALSSDFSDLPFSDVYRTDPFLRRVRNFAMPALAVGGVLVLVSCPVAFILIFLRNVWQ